MAGFLPSWQDLTQGPVFRGSPGGFQVFQFLDFTHLDDFLANAFAKILTANSGLGLQFLLVYYAALFKEYYGNRIHPIKRPRGPFHKAAYDQAQD